MPQVRLERLALLCAAVAVAACSGKDRTSAADSAAMAPAGGAMTSDTGAMSGAARAGGTGGAMGSSTDSANRAGAAGGAGATGGTAGAAGGTGTGGTPGNQTQSGVTNAKTGSSTLGPNIKKVGPTTAADSASQHKPARP